MASSAPSWWLKSWTLESITVDEGTTCSKGRSIARGYSGKVSRFKVSGWKCGFHLRPPPGASTVGCNKGGGIITYTLAVATDCSSTPGVDTQGGTAYGPFVFNIDCASAVPVFNQAGSAQLNVAGWNCSTHSDSFNASVFSCVMKARSTYQMVQGDTSDQV